MIGDASSVWNKKKLNDKKKVVLLTSYDKNKERNSHDENS